jgi:hypothetical protein
MPNGFGDPGRDLRHKLENLFGFPPGSFDPIDNLRKDWGRIKRVLSTPLEGMKGGAYMPDRPLTPGELISLPKWWNPPRIGNGRK